MTTYHPSLASGRWHTLSLAEQMGNIGSEVYRAIHLHHQDQGSFQKAFERALELMDLTIDDSRWKSGRELIRMREVFCDLFFGGNTYHTDAQSLQAYFDQFAVAARAQKERS